MANYSTGSMIFLTFAICFSSLLHYTNGQSHFNVRGKIYCDTCGVQFITKKSFYLEGAKVRFECWDTKTNATIFSREVETNKNGKYELKVPGVHEEELCRVILISSPDPECSEINQDPFVNKASHIVLSRLNGVAGNTRTANPLGFLKKTPLPECSALLKKMGVTASGLVP